MENPVTIIAGICLVLFIVLYFKARESSKSNEKIIQQIRQELREQTEITTSLKINSAELETYKTNNNDLKQTIASLTDKIEHLQSHIPILAQERFESFKATEIDFIRLNLTETITQSAKTELENWKIQYETYYRQDAIARSQAVNLGKITEHFMPFQSDFPFNPKETRFLGSPIDLIVFDGIDNEDIVDIYFLEVKTSGSRMSKRQRLIRDAIQQGRVHFREMRM